MNGKVRPPNISKKIQQEIIKLRRHGYYFREIANKLNISVGSSYKYGSRYKLGKSTEKILKERIKKSTRKPIKLTPGLTLEKVRIIAHCMFDGSVRKGIISYSNTTKELIREFVRDMKIIYGVHPDRVIKKGKKTIVNYYYSEIIDDLKKYAKSFSTVSKVAAIPKQIMNATKEFKREFIRIFWEDEGCITIDGDIIGRIKSKKVRDQLIKLHKNLGIECTPYDCSDGAFGIYIIRNPTNLNKFKYVAFKFSLIARGKNRNMRKIDLFNQIYRKYL